MPTLVKVQTKPMSHLRHCQGGEVQWSAPTSCPTSPPSPHHVTSPPSVRHPSTQVFTGAGEQAIQILRAPACPEVGLVLLRVADY